MSSATPESGRIDTVRALVADDEPTAREYLKLVLSRIDGVEVVGEAEGAAECLTAVAALRPDVLFLDINMPGENGIGLAQALAKVERTPQIVFVTGYDEYALPAFEVAAVDYVMKPFSQERLEQALARVRGRLPASGVTGVSAGACSSLGKLVIRDREGAKLVPVQDICYVETSRRRVIIHTTCASYATYLTIAELEQKLSGYRFFRANEGCLVNLDKVREVSYAGQRTYELLLTEPREHYIPLSRSRAHELRGMLGF